MRGAWLTGLLVAAAAATSLPGCGQEGIQDGHALRQNYPLATGAKPVRPGTELGFLDLYLDNTSSSTVVLSSVGITGPGIGTVARLVQVKIAPLRFGRHTYEEDAVPSSLYSTDPPVNFYGHGCHRQALFAVQGFRMTPGSQVRVWIVIRAMRPGTWTVPQHVIYYTVDGTRFRQPVPLREHGGVEVKAAYIPPDPAQAMCVKPGYATFLPGAHPGSTRR